VTGPANAWGQTPVPFERRPSGTHVISARVPADLAMAVNNHADRTGQRLSDIVRDALAAHLAPAAVTLTITHGDRIRVEPHTGRPPLTYNSNLIVPETMAVSLP
jgi:ribbon-helix-helix CopG family protein